MIDLKQLRDHPQRFKDGAAKKNMPVEIDAVLRLDEERRAILAKKESLRAEQGKIEKELGPQMGKLQGELKKAAPDARGAIEQQIEGLKARPMALKAEVQQYDQKLAELEPRINAIMLQIPQPPDDDVPVGKGSDDNVEVRKWGPAGWDYGKTFEANKGFKAKNHIDLCRDLKLVDFPRGVKMSGTRSYVLSGNGMLLHQAIQRYAVDFMVHMHGYTAMSVPVLVREECMVGTGFFPAGREQAYHIPEKERSGGEGGHDLFLTGTGEVGLMGLHQDEILDEASLPLKYVTVSTCFRREAGAAGKDTAGLYRVHVFDKVEQVVICRADEQESRAWHKKMIGFVEELLQSLELPYRLLQCCTGDLGVKNADMVDIECWMPGRGSQGEFGETHSASRLYDFQCRRLNMRYRSGTDGKAGTVFCHSLNNTVAASPRLMIPILEMHQKADGTVNVPKVLRPYMGGIETIK